ATVHRAFEELQCKGFIVRTSAGMWERGQAATWAVTDRPRRDGDIATNDWRRWSGQIQNLGSPAGRSGRKRPATEPKTSECPAAEPVNKVADPEKRPATELHIHSTRERSGERSGAAGPMADAGRVPGVAVLQNSIDRPLSSTATGRDENLGTPRRA